MMLPCSEVHWKILPAICRQIAVSSEKLGVPRGRIAEALGMTPAAVSQYISGKRGSEKLNSKAVAACEKLARIISEGKISDKEFEAEVSRILVIAKGSKLGKKDACAICMGT